MAVTGSVGDQLINNVGEHSESHRFVLTTDASAGTVGGTPIGMRVGRMVSCKVMPSSGGTQPTNLFGVLLVDGDGYDVLGGKGASLSNAAVTMLTFDPPQLFAGGTLEPQVTAGGNSKVITVEVVILRRDA